jgi:hypothetical protein
VAHEHAKVEQLESEGPPSRVRLRATQTRLYAAREAVEARYRVAGLRCLVSGGQDEASCRWHATSDSRKLYRALLRLQQRPDAPVSRRPEQLPKLAAPPASPPDWL